MLRIFTDFDGPIMDVSERYYRVYRYCLDQVRVPHQPVNVFSKAAFWRLKRAQVPERLIGARSGLSPQQAKQFARLRREVVHSAAYLRYDRVLPGAIAVLERFQAQGYDLVVLTMRRAQSLQQVLQETQMERFFPPQNRYCLPDDHAKEPDVLEKPRLMAQALAELPVASSSWMIGDTEADIAAARAHDLPVIAVLSGIRDRDRLAAYGPDYTVTNLQEAAATIITQSPRPVCHVHSSGCWITEGSY